MEPMEYIRGLERDMAAMGCLNYSLRPPSKERPMKCSRCEAGAPQKPDGYWEADKFGRGQAFSAEYTCSCCKSPLCEFCFKLDQYDTGDEFTELLISEIQKLRKNLRAEQEHRLNQCNQISEDLTKVERRAPRFGWKK